MMIMMVLEKVFYYLQRQSTLLTCRQVCSVWNLEASRRLEKEGVTAQVKGDRALPRFLQTMNEAFTHLFSSFVIELSSTSESDSKDLITFLQSYHIKQLKFEYDLPPEEGGPDDPSEGTLPSIMLPHLTSLHLLSTTIFPPVVPPGTALTIFPRILYSLRTPAILSLSVQHLYQTECATLVGKLLSSRDPSSGPLTLRMPCTEFPRVPISTNSCSFLSLRELDLCDLFHGSFATNETLNFIRAHCPLLEKLGVELGFRVTFDLLFKLLETLSSTLVSLKLIIQDKNLLSRSVQRTAFTFPKMMKLRVLFLRWANPGLVYYLSGCESLESLELETPWTRRVRGNLFPGDEGEGRIFEGVRALCLSDKVTKEDVVKMRAQFPSLRTLCASFKDDEALREVFTCYGGLEGLVIDRNSKVSDGALKEGIGKLGDLRTLKLVQMGFTSEVIDSICLLKKLRNLAIQASVLRTDGVESLTSSPDHLRKLAVSLPHLQTLSIWVRRNSERPSKEELAFLSREFPSWDVNTTIQTVCTLV